MRLEQDWSDFAIKPQRFRKNRTFCNFEIFYRFLYERPTRKFSVDFSMEKPARNLSGKLFKKLPDPWLQTGRCLAEDTVPNKSIKSRSLHANCRTADPEEDGSSVAIGAPWALWWFSVA